MNSGTRENLRIVPLRPGPFDAENAVLVNMKRVCFTEFKYDGRDDDCYLAKYDIVRFNTSTAVKVHASDAEVSAMNWAMAKPVRFIITKVMEAMKDDGAAVNSRGEFVDQYTRCVTTAVRVDEDGAPDKSTEMTLILEGCGCPAFLIHNLFSDFKPESVTWELDQVYIAGVSAFCRDGIISKVFPGDFCK